MIFGTGYGSSVLPERLKSCQTLHKTFNQHQFSEALQTLLADISCEIELT